MFLFRQNLGDGRRRTVALKWREPGRFCSPATQIPRDGYYESSFNECDLSFSYFRLGKFPQPTPDARTRFFWVFGPLRSGPSDVIPSAKQFACTSSSICRTVAPTAIMRIDKRAHANSWTESISTRLVRSEADRGPRKIGCAHQALAKGTPLARNNRKIGHTHGKLIHNNSGDFKTMPRPTLRRRACVIPRCTFARWR